MLVLHAANVRLAGMCLHVHFGMSIWSFVFLWCCSVIWIYALHGALGCIQQVNGNQHCTFTVIRVDHKFEHGMVVALHQLHGVCFVWNALCMTLTAAELHSLRMCVHSLE